MKKLHTIKALKMKYILEDTIYFEHIKNHVVPSEKEFEDLWKVNDYIDSTPNPMNKKYMIKRKQGTYGAQYNFAGQQSKSISSNYVDYPKIIKMVLEDVKILSQSDKYNVVHVNFYPDGSAGLLPHSDTEKDMLDDMNIYSYTFLSEPGNPRGFQIYDQGETEIHNVMLDHGDLLIMSGGMQRKYKHGVKKSTAKKFKALRRINLTVRAWKI